MKISKTFATLTAMAVVAAPAALSAESFDRAAAPVDGESEAVGTGVILGVLGAAAVIAGIIIIADDDDDDDAVSP